MLEEEMLRSLGADGMLPSDQEEDPDPFAIGLALFALLFSGGAYLETRLQRQFLERQARESFRSTYYEARRTLIHARRVVEEFATYVTQEGFGVRQFTFGSVQLRLDVGRAQALRRLHGNAHTTAQFLADNLDALADFLGAEYQGFVDEIHTQLRQITQLPANYDDVVEAARTAITLYERLVNEVGSREKFEQGS